MERATWAVKFPIHLHIITVNCSHTGLSPAPGLLVQSSGTVEKGKSLRTGQGAADYL